MMDETELKAKTMQSVEDDRKQIAKRYPLLSKPMPSFYGEDCAGQKAIQAAFVELCRVATKYLADYRLPLVRINNLMAEMTEHAAHTAEPVDAYATERFVSMAEYEKKMAAVADVDREGDVDAL